MYFVLVVSNTWTDWLWTHFRNSFSFFPLACSSPTVSEFVRFVIILLFILFWFVSFVWVNPACVSYQRQEVPDVSTNELHKGAVIMRSLGEELSVAWSAIVPSAQPSEVFFFFFATEDVVIHPRKTSLRCQKAGRWSMLEIWGFLCFLATLWHNVYARQASCVIQSYYWSN